MTSLSCEDSLAFLDDSRREPNSKVPAPPSSSRQGSGRRQHQRTATATNLSIPRPPPMTRKAQSTASGLPPKAPVLGAAAPLSRPAPLRARAATTGSTSSWSAGSRHRRSPVLTDVLDSLALQSIVQNVHDGLDDDFDDDSTIASSEGDSPIFPFLPAISTASLQGGENYVSSVPSLRHELCHLEEVYLPKCSALERLLQDSDNSTIASVPLLSGWVAYSLGDSLSHKRQLTRHHLAYLTMDDLAGEISFRQPPMLTPKNHTTSSSGQESGEEEGPCCEGSPPLESPSASTVVFKLPRNNRNKISVQTLESQGGAGRSVVIRNHENKTLLTLLPVNLSPQIFCCETGKVLARSLLNASSTCSSVAQHDAALYLWFGLDGWVRRQGQKQQEH